MRPPKGRRKGKSQLQVLSPTRRLLYSPMNSAKTFRVTWTPVIDVINPMGMTRIMHRRTGRRRKGGKKRKTSQRAVGDKRAFALSLVRTRNYSLPKKIEDTEALVGSIEKVGHVGQREEKKNESRNGFENSQTVRPMQPRTMANTVRAR